MEGQNISFVAFESEMTRQERTNKRLWILCIILVVVLVGTNLGWLYYESQFELSTTTTQIEAEQDGSINIISGGGSNYGAESTNH